MRIRFDETNLLADMVGENDGVTRADVQGSRSLAADRRRKAKTKVGKGQGDRGDTGGGIIKAVKQAFGG